MTEMWKLGGLTWMGLARRIWRETREDDIFGRAAQLSYGFLAALWAASNGMGAISESLNIAYDVEETRPWWKARLIAICLTIALAVLIIIALTLVLYGY